MSWTRFAAVTPLSRGNDSRTRGFSSRTKTSERLFVRGDAIRLSNFPLGVDEDRERSVRWHGAENVRTHCDHGRRAVGALSQSFGKMDDLVEGVAVSPKHEGHGATTRDAVEADMAAGGTRQHEVRSPFTPLEAGRQAIARIHVRTSPKGSWPSRCSARWRS